MTCLPLRTATIRPSVRHIRPSVRPSYLSYPSVLSIRPFRPSVRSIRLSYLPVLSVPASYIHLTLPTIPLVYI